MTQEFRDSLKNIRHNTVTATPTPQNATQPANLMGKVGQLANGVVNAFAGNTIELQQDKNKLLDYLNNSGALGKLGANVYPAIDPIGNAVYKAGKMLKGTSVGKASFFQPQEQPTTFRKVAGDTIGSVGEIGSLMLGGELAPLAKGASKIGYVSQNLGKAAKVGGVFNGLVSVGSSLAKGEDAGQVAKSGLTGFAVGTGLTGVGMLAQAGLPKLGSYIETRMANNGVYQAGKNLTKKYVLSSNQGIVETSTKAGYSGLKNISNDLMKSSSETTREVIALQNALNESFEYHLDLKKIAKEGAKIGDKMYYGDDAITLAKQYATEGLDNFGNPLKEVLPFTDGGIATPQEIKKMFYDDVAERASKEGLKTEITYEQAAELGLDPDTIKDKFGKLKIPFKDAIKVFKNYTAHDLVLDPERFKIFLQEGVQRDMSVVDMMKRGVASTEEEAAKLIDDTGRIYNKEAGWKENNSVIKYIADKNFDGDISKAVNAVTKDFFESSKARSTAKFLEKGRLLDMPFINPNPIEATTIYAQESLDNLNKIKYFGINPETGEYKKIEQAVEAVKNYAENPDNVPAEAKDNFIKHFDTLINTTFKRLPKETDEQAISRALTGFGALRLTMSQIRNLGQGITNTSLVTDLGSTAQGFFLAIGQLAKKTVNGNIPDKIDLSGAVDADLIAKALNPGLDVGNGVIGNVLKWTGFKWSEQFNRRVAANAGEIFANKLVKFAGKNADNPDAMFFVNGLANELGIDLKNAVANGGKLTSKDSAMASFMSAGKSQFLSQPGDLPYWASTPIGKLFFQFKSFGYLQTQMLTKELVGFTSANKYVQQRTMKKIATLATIFPLTAEVTEDIKSLITGKERPTNAYDRYMEDFYNSGAIGIVSDMISAAKYDDMGSLVLPASAGSLIDAIKPITSLGSEISNKGEISQSTLEGAFDSATSVVGIPKSLSQNIREGIGFSKKKKNVKNGKESVIETIQRLTK